MTLSHRALEIGARFNTFVRDISNDQLPFVNQRVAEQGAAMDISSCALSNFHGSL
jgi:hypothetical protein